MCFFYVFVLFAVFIIDLLFLAVFVVYCGVDKSELVGVAINANQSYDIRYNWET